MYLKSLTLRGFKTFAHKTVVEFPAQGITAIVGPNGCGKSNLVDSVRWVLGEQSSKELRSSRLPEVIFAGTSTRKPLSLAEVTLCLDNSDNYLPIDYTEVSIKRRIYREGESEFYVNRNFCRLKGIKDLFLDTGLGMDSYSVITQGQVDAILSSHPQDRRAPFEEAAHIGKYKFRKKEAERKLASTEQNLLRVNDLMAELRTQVEVLESQAGKARKYKEIKDHLRDLEIGISKKRLAILERRTEELGQRVVELKTRSISEFEDVGKIKKERESLREKLKALEEELFKTRLKIKKTRDEFGTLKEEIAVEKERLQNSKESAKRIQEEGESLRIRAQELKEEISKVEIKLKELRELLKEKLQRIRDLEKELSGLKTKLSIEESLIMSSAKLAVLSDFERDCGDCEKFKKRKQEMESLEGQLQRLEREKERISTQELKIKEDLKIREREMEGLTQKVKAKEILQATLSHELRLVEHQRLKVEGRLEVDLIRRGQERIARLLETLPKLEEEERLESEKLEALEKEKGKIMGKIEGLERDLSSEMESEWSLKDELSKLEVSLGRLEAEREAILERMADEYNLSRQALAKVKLEISEPREAKAEVEKFKAELLGLEPVNLLAIHEFEKAKQRLTFLEKQSHDLTSARVQVERLMADLDTKARKNFLEVIEVVGKHFSEIFATLFEGGEAKLILADPQNVLESGIEIMARPHGRKLLPLSLLSGGERALTAIAILFALLKTHPSPFCFLDEVDATLDEANIFRFTKMLREFAKSIQMIVITHSKRTMAMADVLYGITMEEPGVSKLISMRLAGSPLESYAGN